MIRTGTAGASSPRSISVEHVKHRIAYFTLDGATDPSPQVRKRRMCGRAPRPGPSTGPSPGRRNPPPKWGHLHCPCSDRRGPRLDRRTVRRTPRGEACGRPTARQGSPRRCPAPPGPSASALHLPTAVARRHTSFGSARHRSRVERRRVAGRGPVTYPVLSQPGRRPTPVGGEPPHATGSGVVGRPTGGTAALAAPE